jgi:hypothetical protein
LNHWFLAAACLAGVMAAEGVVKSVVCRDRIGVWSGRGKLIALVDGTGIYETDVARGLGELQERGANDQTSEQSKGAILQEWMADIKVSHLARHKRVPEPELGQRMEALRAQLPRQAWRDVYQASGTSAGSLRHQTIHNLQGGHWVEKRIRRASRVTPEECGQFYQQHLTAYAEPLRFRASHIFLAAPPETPPDVVAKKKSAIEAISEQLLHGAPFADLAASASEDEATKGKGGDLGWFSEWRMPADFMAVVAKMRVGETSKVVRTRLGFHIIQLAEVKPPRQMSLDEARREIALALRNEKRSAARENLVKELAAGAEFVRGQPPK